MSTKLTLAIDENVIKKAKEYVKKNGTSLSQVIENYLASLTIKDNSKDEISPLVKSLSGVIKLPAGYDHKKERTKHLQEKYK